MLKIATPISTLFPDNEEKAKQVIDLSDVLEVRELSKKTNYGLPLIYHCESSLIHKWFEQEKKQIKSIFSKNPKIFFISFHLLNDYADFKISSEEKFLPGMIKMSGAEMLTNAAKNLAWLKKNLPKNVKYGVENNNYFPTGAYETVVEPPFINNLVAKLDISLLLDLGHAELTAHYQKIGTLDYIKKFNLEKVLQVHLSSPTISEKNCQDSHNELNEKNWELFSKVLPLCSNLKFITIEYYKDIDKLIEMLKILKNILYEYKR